MTSSRLGFGLVVLLLSGCAATVEVTRTRPAPVRHTDTTMAVAASGAYAPELIAGTRALLEGRVKVESCVLGCPAVGLYASLTLTPGPQEARTARTCQAEVYTGKSWAAPEAVRGTFVKTVDELDACLGALGRWFTEARREAVRVRLDDEGPLRAVTLLLREGRLDDARARLEALVAAPNATAGAWFNLGVVHEAQGRVTDARRCYERALTLSPPAWMKTASDEALRSLE
ncbi:MAG: tetratricopeptide repeat protein [Myxococcaceae bacterium]|nr:tetratricopeptide repeat protein [Myxococcaceae bacterium]